MIYCFLGRWKYRFLMRAIKLVKVLRTFILLKVVALGVAQMVSNFVLVILFLINCLSLLCFCCCFGMKMIYFFLGRWKNRFLLRATKLVKLSWI